MNPQRVPALIGITGRRWPGRRVSSLDDRYQVRDVDFGFADFSRCIAAAGAIPVTIPYDADPRSLVFRLDGLLLTGGEDIVPRRWGGDDDDAIGEVSGQRDDYELALFDAATHQGLPTLGICRGMQIINVARGGSLIGDLVRDGREHRNPGMPVDDLAHEVTLMDGTLAAQVYGVTYRVNSLHHQSCDREGDGVLISGRASDGTAETLEVLGSPVLGVQWHPEWMPHPDPAFRWLASAAEQRSAGANHQPYQSKSGVVT